MKKVLIIGAGPAGLTAAVELLKNNGKEEYEVTIVEESDVIGGISQTVRYNGNRMDIGGHRFFSKSEEIMNWWNELMPVQGKPAYDDKVLGIEKPLAENGPDPEQDDVVMLVRNRVSRIYYNHKFFDYPISMKPQTIKNMGFATTMKSGCSYLKSSVHKLPETSLENFYINRFGKKLYSMFFEGYTEKLWGRHPREISADWGAQRVKGLSITALIKDMFKKTFGGKKDNKNVETSLIEQYWYPKYGPGQLWELAADKAQEMGATLIKNCRAIDIVTDSNRVTSVLCETPDGKKAFHADIVISSMPVKDLVGGMNDVPKNIAEDAEGLPYRDFVTVGLLVNKLNLVNETDRKTLGNIVPDCWIYVQDTGVKLGRIQIFNNWSPYMVKQPENTVWIGLEYFCKEGDEFWNMADDECIEFAKNELVSMGIIDKKNVLDAHREKIKKAYPAYFDTYENFDDVIDYLDKYNNLFCVGRNGQHRYNNMDHSMMTAIKAVEAIKNNSSDKTEIWNVNTEKEYHETKEDKAE